MHARTSLIAVALALFAVACGDLRQASDTGRRIRERLPVKDARVEVDRSGSRSTVSVTIADPAPSADPAELARAAAGIVRTGFSLGPADSIRVEISSTTTAGAVSKRSTYRVTLPGSE